MLVAHAWHCSVATKFWKVTRNMATLATYLHVFLHFATVALKSLSPSSATGFTLPIPEDIKLLGELVLENKTKEALHDFIFALLSIPPADLMVDKWQDPVACFLALVALQEGKGFRPAIDICPYLSRTKYFMRIVCFAETQRRSLRVGEEAHFYQLGKDVAKEVLDQEPVNSFSRLCRLSTYAASIALNTPRAGNMSWDPDYTKCEMDGKIIRMSKFQSGNRKAIQDIGDRIDAIQCGHDIPCEVKEDYVDNMFDGSFGCSLVDNGSQVPEHALLQAILEDPESGFLVNNQLSIPKAHAFLQEANEIAMQLGLVMHTTNGPPPRGTECSGLRLRNGEQKRGLYYLHQAMIGVLEYSKTSNNVGVDKHIPFQLHCSVSDLMLRYLFVIRPMEVHLAKRLFAPQEAALYSEYFLLKKNKRVDSDKFSKALANFTGTYFGVRMGVKDYRHFAVGVSREFIHPAYNPFEDEENDIGDLQAGHSSAIAKHHYARLINSEDWKNTAVLRNHCDYSRKWHVVCGLGGRAVPLYFINPHTYTGSTSTTEHPFKDRSLPSEHQQTSTTVPSAPASSVDAASTNALLTAINTLRNEMHSLRSEIQDDRALLPTLIKSTVFESIIQCSKQMAIPGIQKPSAAPPRAPAPAPRPSAARPSPLPNVPASAPNPVLAPQARHAIPVAEFEQSVSPPPSNTGPDDAMDQDMDNAQHKELSRVQSPSQITEVMEDAMLAHMRDAYDKPHIQWKSMGQKCLVLSSLLTDRNIVGSIPTGGGKSAAFEVPAFSFEKGRTMLLILPYRSLMLQFMTRLEEMCIEAREWTSAACNIHPAPTVLLISPERCDRNDLFG